MKKILLLALFFSSVIAVSAQSFTLSGYMKDQDTGEDLMYATVSVDGSGEGVTTNLYGFYSLTLPEGDYVIAYSYVGFETQRIEIKLDKDQELTIELGSGANELDEVTITAERADDNVTSTEVGVVTLDVKETMKIPVLMGEQNIMKTFQLMPGVASSSEGGSGFFVRGGAADQNLILLDEAPVYNASHLLGFFSVFNSDALKDVKLYKGGIPAEYGGRASSVMDVRMKEGNLKEWGASGGIGVISSRLTVEGPFDKDKGSIIVSGRRTYADVVARTFTDDFDGVSLYFYDLNAKANYKIGSKDRIYLSGYLGRDAFGVDDLGFDWGNTTFTGRWNHTFNNKLFSNTSLVYSDYNYGFGLNVGDIDVDLSSGIYDYLLKQDYNYFLNPNNTMKFGWQSNFHEFRPNEFSFDNEVETALPSSRLALENALYWSNEQKLSDRFTANYGLRLSSFSNIGNLSESEIEEGGNAEYENGEFYNTFLGVEPRVSATYLLDAKSSIKASYNRNYQYLHLLSNSNSGTPTDIWLPSSPVVLPTIADQVALGYFRNFKSNTYKFSTEVYYKWLQNTVDYKDGAETFGNNDVESQLVFGEGRTYGAEFLLEKTKGRLTGWLGYTLSSSELRSDDINQGNWYSARQDRTHDLSLVAIYELTKKLSLSATWVYYTGDAVTFPAGKYYIDGSLINLYSARNADRMPTYHRLDAGLTWTIKDTDKFSNSLNFSAYNVYNRKNAYSITFQEGESGNTEASRLALFGIIPSVTWNFSF
ncbi:TonB-dependent receptor [Portibacter lacus]|uniref:Collagen-binding protein n=1 Tax=Portibacter lacus TaxID=1099794 RepID=A0AA37SU46_9BACT|nr:TonB-dependent receptor [Portibacter lacus]GLR19659.1 collagen-binding protein [Portibacter lacus]